MKSFVEIAELGKTYPTPAGPAVIVRDFTLDVDEGEVVCLLGHSGGGKTTGLSILMGLTKPNTGGGGDGGGARRCRISVAPCCVREWPNGLWRGGFPAPATSNPACGFPALGFPACFISKFMGPIMLDWLSAPPPVVEPGNP